jgi:hypothetical protein
MKPKKNRWKMRAVAAVTAVSLVLAFMPQTASAAGYAVESEKAAGNGTGVAQSDAGQVRAESPGVAELPKNAPSNGRDAVDSIRKMLRESDSEPLATGLGAPPVDAEVTGFPFKDERTIDDQTHKIVISGEGTNETLELRGYVYKLNLRKGEAYSLNMIFNPAESFACMAVFLDGNSNMVDDDSLYAFDDLFVASKSGVVYMLVTDLGVTTGGKYTMQIERASLITGKVTDSRGKALKNAMVIYYAAKKARNPQDYIGYVETDARGRYTIGVKPGSYKLFFSVDATAYSPPKYRSEYYNNKHSIGKARAIKVAAGRTKSGANVSLSPYRAPKADKKIASLPFKQSSRVTAKSREVEISGTLPFRAKVYSVRLSEGRTYELLLKGGKGAYNPFAWVVDSKGYDAGGTVAWSSDKNTAASSMKVGKTDDYRIVVADAEGPGSMRFSLEISEAFTPGTIMGKVTNKAGHPLGYFEVSVLKKYGKRWISYTGGVTGFDGRYRVGGLKAGTYKVMFSDSISEGEPDGRIKYYREDHPNGTKTSSKGTPVEVGAGGVVSAIDICY